ncbi:ribosomal biogenesis factor-like [Cervus canadensis]|uniref:ribosomal biogenesis factor-like n=1 Tax=Cervus canadensis TaxID=1574408 RepID=UPI001C9E9BAC|nr:ribosomal biogenesis factor-like [Cervus canadensis]
MASRESEAKDKLREQKSRHVLHIVNQKNFQVKDKAKLATTDLKERNTLIPQQGHENKPVNVDEATSLMAQV